AVEPIRAVRIWPAADYTRLTLETAEPLRYNLLSLKNPDRLVLDLEDVEPERVQELLAGKILPIDPYIGAARVGRFKPSVARLVLDLKEAVKPQIFVLAPVGDYGHRLVLDLYPAVPLDPLMALLQKQELDPALAGPVDPSAPKGLPEGAKPRGAPRPAVVRLITVAIDAGHGGEDPGAKGRRGTYEKNVTLLIARKLKAVIDAEPNMRALLTRDGDYYIALGERVDKARRVKADLFVSVH